MEARRKQPIKGGQCELPRHSVKLADAIKTVATILQQAEQGSSLGTGVRI